MSTIVHRVLPAEPRSEMSIMEYLRVLRRRVRLVGLVGLLALVLTAVYAFTAKPSYSSSARIVVRPSAAQTVLSGSAAAAEDPTVIPTDLQLFSSQSVQSQASRTLGGSDTGVTAAQVGTSNVIDVVATAASPGRAAAIANAYSQAFVSVIAAQDQTNLNAAVVRITNQINALAAQQLAAKPGSAAAASLAEQQAALGQQLGELQLNASVAGSGTVVSAPAVPQTSPVSPKKARDLGLGLIAGLLLGCVIAFVREFTDDSLKTREDVEALLGEGSTLGVVPRVAGWDDPSVPIVVSLTDPKSPAAEAYRSVRTSVEFLRLDRDIRSLQITSPRAGEGKTTTAVNLAVALAKSDQRVALMSCDLRRPRLHTFFGIDNERGFTSVAAGQCTLADVLVAAPSDDRILVLPSGPVPTNPAEILASHLTDRVVDDLKTRVDVVIIDSPPVLPVTDASLLARHVDATLVVATANRTTKNDLREAVDALRQVDAPLLGTVLNAATASDRYEAYGYGYGYGYGYEPREIVAPTAALGRRLIGARVASRSVALIAGLAILGGVVGAVLPTGTDKYRAMAVVDLHGALGPKTSASTVLNLVRQPNTVQNALTTTDLNIAPNRVTSEVSISIDESGQVATIEVTDKDRVNSAVLATALANATVNSLDSGNTSGTPVVARTAVVPTSKGTGHSPLNVLIGVVLGVLVGLASCAAWVSRRRKIRSARDLERRSGLRVLGSYSFDPARALKDA